MLTVEDEVDSKKRFFTRDDINYVKNLEYSYWSSRPEYANIFNPFQRAEQKTFSYTGKIALITDTIQRNLFVTAIAGYHDLKLESNRVLEFLSPNIRMILKPKTVAGKSHFGLGTYITNPFAPLASALAIARTDAMSLSADCKAYLQDDSINRYTIASALLFPPTALLAILAIVIDVVKMLATYAVLLPIMLLTAPITVPLAGRYLAGGTISHHDYHEMDDQEQGEDDTRYREHAVEL